MPEIPVCLRQRIVAAQVFIIEIVACGTGKMDLRIVPVRGQTRPFILNSVKRKDISYKETQKQSA